MVDVLTHSADGMALDWAIAQFIAKTPMEWEWRERGYLAGFAMHGVERLLFVYIAPADISDEPELLGVSRFSPTADVHNSGVLLELLISAGPWVVESEAGEVIVSNYSTDCSPLSSNWGMKFVTSAPTLALAVSRAFALSKLGDSFKAPAMLVLR